jgi:hypothetical protein
MNINVIPANINLYGKPLPWVDSHIHLGITINRDGSLDHDLLCKRGEFISKVHSLRQELGDQSPEVFMRLVNVYLTSMYGSNTWDLFGPAARKLFISWNVLVRNTFKLPFATHRFILQEIESGPHLKVQLCKRFIKFYNQLKNNVKPEIRHLFNIQKYDFRSNFGRNCQYLCNELNSSSIENINVSEVVMPIKTPEAESWRVPFLKDLLALTHFCIA